MLEAFLIDGADNATIARRLGISVDTVRVQFTRIRTRTGLTSKTALAVAVLSGHIEIQQNSWWAQKRAA